MSQENAKSRINADATEAGWNSLYRVAGAGTLITVVFILVDIGLTAAGGDLEAGKMSTLDWFAHFQDNWFLGLRNFGFFNVLNILLTIPLYLALYRMHRGVSQAYAALALIVFLVDAALYVGNNRALSMLDLSQQYAAATTEAQKSLLLTAGTVILAQSEDFTPGSFMGFLLSNLAGILMALVVLRGKVFSKWIGLAGLVGSSCLLFFTVAATFTPAIYDLALLICVAGGLMMMGWNISIALAMLRLARSSSGNPSAQAAPAHLAAPEM